MISTEKTSPPPRRRRTRRARYALLALPIASGAPLGWLLLSYLLQGDAWSPVAWSMREFTQHTALYAYLEISTTVVLANLGWVLGALTDRLERDALTDALTGLHNRRYLEARLVEEMTRAQRYGTTLALVVIDVDHFKSINDRDGHDVGDATLKKVARQVQTAVRGCDIAARPAGDEFVVLLPQTDTSAAEAFAERLRKTISDNLDGITVSIGACLYRSDVQKTPRDFFSGADRALYAAKRAGRNCVRFSR